VSRSLCPDSLGSGILKKHMRSGEWVVVFFSGSLNSIGIRGGDEVPCMEKERSLPSHILPVSATLAMPVKNAYRSRLDRLISSGKSINSVSPPETTSP
jgi:hypothetical protein